MTHHVRMTPRTKALGLAMPALVLVLLTAGCGGGGDDPTPSPTTAAPTTVATNEQAADGQQETTPPPPELTSAPAPKPKAWHTVATLTGSANKRGAAFALHGRARLSYTARDASGLGSVLVAVYVMEEGTSLAADGGFPEVTVTTPGPGSTELANPPGRYYLEVNGANARWTVTVQELS